MSDGPRHGSRLRYPGSPPFGDSTLDSMLFFGREAEAEAALHSILSHDLFVLYARSGVGKTSLLKARVAHHLKERDLWPVFVRMADSDTAPTSLVRQALVDQAADATIEVAGIDDGNDGLFDLLSKVRMWRHDILQLPVLVFDQFEELFTLWDRNADERASFIEQLAGVIRGVPARYSADSATADTMMRPRVKIVLVLREEFLGELDVFSATIPKVLTHRQRLEPLTPQQAIEAIEEPAKLDEPGLTPPFAFDQGAVEALVETLGGGSEREPRSAQSHSTRGLPFEGRTVGPTGAALHDGGSIEASQLQILCRYVETQIVAGRHGVTVTADDFPKEGPTEILKGFYEEELAKFGSRGERRQVRKLCEEKLISEGRRRSLDARALAVDEQLLDTLVDRRLLRRESRADRFYYELAHDSLVEPLTRYRTEHTARTRQRTLAGIAAVAIVGFAVAAFATGRGSSGQAAPAVTVPTAVVLVVGDTAAGSIAMPGEVDRFQFDGDAGSAVTLTMRPTGELDGVLEVHTSESGSLARVDAADARGVEVVSFILDETGTYDVPVQGASGSTGDYELSLQQAVELVEGEELSGSIDGVGEIDQFPFAGQTGRAVTITLQSDDDLDGVVAVLDASGGEIARSNSGLANGPEIVTMTLPDDGTYVVVVTGATESAGSTGPYTLTMQRTEELSNGQPVDGSIDVDGEVDRFPFTGRAGTAVTVTVTPDDGLNALVEVIDPAGARIEQIDSAGTGQPETITVILPVDGTYVVPVRGSPDSTGSFTARLDESVISDIEIGEGATGSIGERAPVGVFRFAGRADALMTVVVQPEGPLDLVLDMLDPGAVRVGTVDAFGEEISETFTGRLLEDGQYVVIVQGRNGSTGPFRLTVIDVRAPLRDGTAQNAIDQNGEVDVFEFDGEADEVVKLTMRPTDDDPMDAQLGLLKTDGGQIDFVDDAFAGDAETILAVLPEGGTYVVVARGFTGSTGGYEIRLDSLTAESIAIATPTAGSIDEQGEVVVFRFTTAAPGSRLQVDLESTARLEFDLIDPSDDVIVEGSESALLTLRREGEYHLAVRARGSSRGPFTLNLAELSVENLQIGEPVERTIDQVGEVDVFEFYGTADTPVSLTVQPESGLAPQLDLLDASTGEGVGFPTTDPDGTQIREGFLPDDGAYLVYIRAPDGSTGPYTLTLS